MRGSFDSENWGTCGHFVLAYLFEIEAAVARLKYFVWLFPVDSRGLCSSSNACIRLDVFLQLDRINTH